MPFHSQHFILLSDMKAFPRHFAYIRCDHHMCVVFNLFNLKYNIENVCIRKYDVLTQNRNDHIILHDLH